MVEVELVDEEDDEVELELLDIDEEDDELDENEELYGYQVKFLILLD